MVGISGTEFETDLDGLHYSHVIRASIVDLMVNITLLIAYSCIATGLGHLCLKKIM